MRAYTADELNEMETLESGHSQDLKVDETDYRVWQCRIDDEPEYEIYWGGKWYEATVTGGPSGYQYLEVMIDID